MTLLVLSIVFFLVGVWLPSLLGSKKHLLERFDRALALIVLLIVLLDLLPESYATAGLWLKPESISNFFSSSTASRWMEVVIFSMSIPDQQRRGRSNASNNLLRSMASR